MNAFLKTIGLFFTLLIVGSCSKSIDYQPVVTSAQSLTVYLAYPDGYWGSSETLAITHSENGNATVPFELGTVPNNAEARCCVKLNVPRPNNNDLEWSDDRLTAKGHATVTFKSSDRDFVLRFEQTLHFSEKKDMLGGSSMYVSAVSSKTNRVERTGNPFNENFIIDIDGMIK